VKKKLFIIDGHALCYRAYFAFAQNPLTNSKGQNVSAIFGFSRMLLTLIREQKPDYLAVAFDPPEKSFRFQLYDEYKANRQKMPDDLRAQIEEIKTLVKELGLPVIVMDGWEADDVLGSAAHRFASKDCTVVIVTGDKDAYQLVGKHVHIYANRKGISEHEIYGPDEVLAKLGVRHDQVIDYMALTGDTSDNVPGVKGIGEKTAQKLISQYETLDGIYDHIDEIKGKLGENLRAHRDMAYLSRDLVTIRTNVELDADLPALAFNGIEPVRAKERFGALEMKSIVRDFFSSAPTTVTAESAEMSDGENVSSIKSSPHEYTIIRDMKILDDVIRQIESAGRVSVDTETTSVKPVDADLVGISLSVRTGQGWFIPVLSQTLFGDDIIPPEKTIAALKPVLENSSIKKYGQNIKYDMIVLGNAGIVLAGITGDAMIASYLLDPSERKHNLDDMALEHLGYKTVTYEELTGKGRNAVPITDVPLEKLSDYACEDADIALRLCELLERKCDDAGLGKLYRETELPLVEVLAAMERAGVLIDGRYFASLSKELDERIVESSAKIIEAAGEQFNLNSTKELARILFDKLKLPTVKKTKTGFSTDISVLEELEGSHPIIRHLIDYRTFAKLKNTYIETLPELVSSRTGRIHTSFNQTIVATGRLSSSDPNLQNIPARDDFGKRIRGGFVPDKGKLILSADYSQIELRIAAHVSGDDNMIRAFREGIDIHRLTASSVFGVPIDAVEDWMRRQAKVINFATIYGVSPFGLSKQADISMRDAARFIERYFETYPKFREYIDRTVAFAQKHGYVETLLGRRRPIPDITSSAVFRFEGAKRIAINTPIQGTSADLIKIAMRRIYDDLRAKKMSSKLILQVHDELVFESPEPEKDDLAALVKERMEHAMSLNVPIIVDIASGKSWGEAH
jgi:DNA polymerase-1